MNKLVERARDQGRKVTRDEIANLGRNLEEGLDLDDSLNSKIRDFNLGVRQSRNRWVEGGQGRGFRIERTDDYIENYGRRCAGSGRYRKLLIGAGALAALSSIFQQAGAVAEEIKDENSRIRGAIRRIEDDDFVGAQELLEKMVEEIQAEGLWGYGKEIFYKDAIATALNQIRERANQLELMFGVDIPEPGLDSPEAEEVAPSPVFGLGIQ